MSYQELKSSHPVGRKQYSCAWCAEKILVGEKHLSRSYIFDREFNSDRMHLECEKAMMNTSTDDLSYGWLPGEYERGLNGDKL